MRKILLNEFEEQIKNEELDLNPEFQNIIVVSEDREVLIELFYNDLREFYDSDDAFIWSITTKGGVEIRGVDLYELLVLIEDLLK